MSFSFDDVVNQIGTFYDDTVNSASKYISSYFDAESDKVQEKLTYNRESSAQEANNTNNSEGTNKQAGQQVDWQKWGVIVGASALAITVLKMVK